MASLPAVPRAVFQRWLDRRAPAAPYVRLDHRRIFILPTRVGLAFLCALVIMLLAAVNYQNSLAYALTFLLGSLFVIAILHTYRNLAGLELHGGSAPAVFVGETASLGVRLESAGRPHQAIALGWSGKELRSVEVPARGSCDLTLERPAERRGRLRPGRLRVETRFPLGVFVAWSSIDLNLATLVYPKPESGALPPLSDGSDDLEADGGRVTGAGSDDYQGLRSWQPGESIRRVDWKAFSREQGLLTKDFSALGGGQLTLDYAVLEGDTEARLSRLCHWVIALTEQDRPFCLHLPGQRIEPDSGPRHRDACLTALALFGEDE
ncbi:DUF58 domain-containing protein [Stutzerimonas tarimensis]|uniref:DUF58 domain-containing protein n=1 Tax=Stutzerimonas tarimensis TaxID=1507735 RepID=A0ABV7T3H0_9GAMM